MHKFETTTGRIVDIRRFLTRPTRLRDFPAHERWELWLAGADGAEQKYIVASRVLPARTGHAVTLLLAGNDELVGLYNLDAGYRVNFAREEPELLLQAKDVAVAVFGALGTLIGSGFAGPGILWLAVPALLLYVPVKMMARLRRRQILQRQVDQLLDQMQFDRVVRPFRK